MEYRIRIQPGKEKPFKQIIKALQSLGVIEKVEKVSGRKKPSREDAEEQGSSPEELASQYRDLVD